MPSQVGCPLHCWTAALFRGQPDRCPAGIRSSGGRAADGSRFYSRPQPDRAADGRDCDTIYRFDVEKLGAGQKPGDEQVEFDKAPIDEISHMTFAVDEKLAPKLQSELNQTTSGIPLEWSEPVQGSYIIFHRERATHALSRFPPRWPLPGVN